MKRNTVVPTLAGVISLTLGAGLAGAPTSASSSTPALPAFPGAEGFGAGATGGRGGSVVIVSTLEPFGPGSLGEALAPEVCEPRTVVFRVSGVIEVPGRHDLELTCGNVTIAGQTAPGAGITLNGRIDGYGADPAATSSSATSASGHRRSRRPRAVSTTSERCTTRCSCRTTRT